MKRIETRTANSRKMLALLLMLTANLFLSQVGVMAQKKGTLKPTAVGGDGFSGASFTVTGSTGEVDESDLGIADVNFNYVGHKAGKTGTVHIRYNIVALEGIAQEDTNFNGTEHVRVRFRDSDGHMTNQQVKFSIWRTSFATGVDTSIFTFDSNVDGADIGATQVVEITDCEHPDFDFDFSTYFYWIDAEVTRTQAGGIARLSGIQISEASATSCSA